MERNILSKKKARLKTPLDRRPRQTQQRSTRHSPEPTSSRVAPYKERSSKSATELEGWLEAESEVLEP
jgi:hypothetical protein